MIDVAVVGGGVMGAAAAERLASAGLRTVLYEARGPAHPGGSSHGDGRILRWTYGEDEYLAMAERAFAAWRELEERSGEELVIRTGGWECAPPGNGALEEVRAGLDRAGRAFDLLDAAASRRRFPWLRLPDGWVALHQAESSIVRAGRAVETLWKLAADAGAELRRVAIEAVEPLPGGGFRLRPADADDAPVARRVVLAAGAWSARLAASLGVDLPLRITRETIAWFPALRRDAEHAVGRCPTVIDYGGELPFYALPRIDVPGVKVGRHRSGPDLEPEPVPPGTNRPAPTEALQPLRAWIGERFPDLGPAPIAVQTCLYSLTPDLHFVVDAPAEVPGLVLAAGFSGHGFKFAPVVGEQVLALIRDAEGTDAPPDLFRLGRFRHREGLVPRRGA